MGWLDAFVTLLDRLRPRGPVLLGNAIPGSGDRPEGASLHDRYEEKALAGLAETTFRKASGVLDAFTEAVKPRLLASVTADLLSRYEKHLRDGSRAETTIKGHLAHLSAALSWAAEKGLIAVAPKIRMPRRAKKPKLMKGRPVTAGEFERMLAAVPAVLFPEGVPVKEDRKPAILDSWVFFLRGLWVSGLRLDESMHLAWQPGAGGISIDGLDGAEPMLLVPAEAEKGHEDRLLPMAPEFAELLRTVPQARRTGYVFDPRPRQQRYGRYLTAHRVGLVVSAIGEAAGVLVAERFKPGGPGKTGKIVKKWASTHDLRRSFGERWAPRVMPAVLQELMRHESIQTTMRYYVGQNARRTAAILWEAHRASSEKVGATLGATSNSATSESS